VIYGVESFYVLLAFIMAGVVIALYLMFGKVEDKTRPKKH